MNNQREIKFRAWDRTTQKFAVGQLAVLFNSGIVHCPYGTGGDKDWEYKNEKTDGIPNLILMQFTGLLDKNGKEIFEGDVIETDATNPDRKIVSIEWMDKWEGKWNGHLAAGWGVRYKDGQLEMLANAQLHPENNYEIIGNIWENPELIK